MALWKTTIQRLEAIIGKSENKSLKNKKFNYYFMAIAPGLYVDKDDYFLVNYYRAQRRIAAEYREKFYQLQPKTIS